MRSHPALACALLSEPPPQCSRLPVLCTRAHKPYRSPSAWRRAASRPASQPRRPERAPRLQVLQPLGVDGERAAVAGERKQVHVADALLLLLLRRGLRLRLDARAEAVHLRAAPSPSPCIPPSRAGLSLAVRLSAVSTAFASGLIPD